MLNKGSKCKCNLQDDNIFTKNETQYDEISMNSDAAENNMLG